MLMRFRFTSIWVTVPSRLFIWFRKARLDLWLLFTGMCRFSVLGWWCCWVFGFRLVFVGLFCFICFREAIELIFLCAKFLILGLIFCGWGCGPANWIFVCSCSCILFTLTSRPRFSRPLRSNFVDLILLPTPLSTTPSVVDFISVVVCVSKPVIRTTRTFFTLLTMKYNVEFCWGRTLFS